MSDEQLEDYLRDPNFERRVVVFYDVLGWRGLTENTLGIPERIGRLRREILLHTRILHQMAASSSNVTTFSDSVVISAPVDEHVPAMLRAVTLMQMMAQSRGFLLRGGITLGDIIHDNECVFGPGLNRAYDLEHTVLQFPRIVLDKEVLECGDLSEFCSTESGVTFLDPHRRQFLNQLTSIWDIGPEGEDWKAEDVWKADYKTFVEVLVSPLDTRKHEKIAWIVDRIAMHASFAAANTYPRKRPPRTPLQNYVRAAFRYLTGDR